MPLCQKLKKAGCIFFPITVLGTYPHISKCHFWAIFGPKFSFLSTYLWNGASTSKIEESGMQFFWDFGPGEVPPDIKMSFLGHFWAILSHFWYFLGHFGPYRVILGHFFPILDHFWSQVGPTDIKMSFLGHFGSFLAHIRSFGAI